METSFGSDSLSNNASDKKNRTTLRNAGEHSIITALAKSCSASLTQALRWMMWWMTIVEKPSDAPISLELNTDYESGALGGQDLTALVSAWQAGAISSGQLATELKKGEVG